MSQPNQSATIGRYTIARCLGAGGMGAVYLAHTDGGHSVAIKVIRSEFTQEPQFRTRFRREIDAIGRISPLYTPPIVDADPDADSPWFATTYLEAESLQARVERDGPLGAGDVRSLTAGLAEALCAVHAVGLVHRDVTPGNVLLMPSGPRLIDFGIARGHATTMTAGYIGTIHYASPEHFDTPRLGPHSDVYSLGATLCFAATGRSPAGQGTTHEILARVLQGQLDLTGVPAPVRVLIEPCLKAAPADRPTAGGLLSRISGRPARAVVPDRPVPVQEARAQAVGTVVDIDLAVPAPEPVAPAVAVAAAEPVVPKQSVPAPVVAKPGGLLGARADASMSLAKTAMAPAIRRPGSARLIPFRPLVALVLAALVVGSVAILGAANPTTTPPCVLTAYSAPDGAKFDQLIDALEHDHPPAPLSVTSANGIVHVPAGHDVAFTYPGSAAKGFTEKLVVAGITTSSDISGDRSSKAWISGSHLTGQAPTDIVGYQATVNRCQYAITLVTDRSPFASPLGLVGLLMLLVFGALTAFTAFRMRGVRASALGAALGALAGLGAGALAYEAGWFSPFGSSVFAMPVAGLLLGSILPWLRRASTTSH